MESRLAELMEYELIESTQRLSPTQRLEAFLAHSQLMTYLYLAGKHQREQAPPHSS